MTDEHELDYSEWELTPEGERLLNSAVTEFLSPDAVSVMGSIVAGESRPLSVGEAWAMDKAIAAGYIRSTDLDDRPGSLM